MCMSILPAHSVFVLIPGTGVKHDCKAHMGAGN